MLVQQYADVWMCDLKSIENGLQGKHLCIVLSNNEYCKNSNMLTCIPITSNINKFKYYNNVILKNKFKKTSIALVSQIRPISKTDMLYFKFKLNEIELIKINNALDYSINRISKSDLIKKNYGLDRILNMIDIINNDIDDILEKKNLLNELKNLCNENNINFNNEWFNNNSERSIKIG